MGDITVYPAKKRIVVALIVVIVLTALFFILALCTPSRIAPLSWLFIAMPCLIPVCRAVYLLYKYRPFMFITNEGIKVNSKEPWEVRFADVEQFIPISHRGYQLIGIRYKKNTPCWKSDEEMGEDRKERMLCQEHPGAPYDILAENLSMSREELLEVLNKRINCCSSHPESIQQ